LVTGVAIGSTPTMASKTNADGTTVTSNTANIDVTPVIVSIKVTPEDVSIVGVNTQQLTAIATYSDSSTDDVTNQVSWNVDDTTIAVISASSGGTGGGVVSNGTASDGTTTATASLTGVTSNTVNIAACNTLAGPCIDTFDTGGGKLFTNSPSKAYLDSVGGSPNDGTYLEYGISGSSGEFYLFNWNHVNDLCDTYSTNALAGRTNWRMPTKSELKSELYDTYGNMFTARGWPANVSYFSSTAFGSNYFDVSLANGNVYSNPPGNGHYASCVSEYP
ncbi:DUF1566 domain-containing protein, partial [Vibrio parahaemolyticus]